MPGSSAAVQRTGSGGVGYPGWWGDGVLGTGWWGTGYGVLGTGTSIEAKDQY